LRSEVISNIFFFKLKLSILVPTHTVNLSFLKRLCGRYQTLASFFKAFEIFKNRSCN
jgi:hypothetical protein